MSVSVEQRLAELEKSVQWWRGLTLSVCIILVGVVVMIALVGRRALSGSVKAVQGDFQHLRARSVEVVDSRNNVVVSLQAAGGGGAVNVTSATPNDHDVLIIANPVSANVQVSHQGAPRQFGLLSILQRKAVFRSYEENPGGRPNHFYQFPRYEPDGSLASPKE